MFVFEKDQLILEMKYDNCVNIIGRPAEASLAAMGPQHIKKLINLQNSFVTKKLMTCVMVRRNANC